MSRTPRLVALVAALLVALISPGIGGGPAAAADGDYLIGRGTSDITGEPAEDGMLGYGSLTQISTGIHTRQRSRAFIVADRDDTRRVVFVEADIPLMSDLVRTEVLRQLGARHGTRYTEQNVTWDIPSNATPGTYRIVYRGDAGGLLGSTPITGTTRTFTVQ